MRTSSVWFTFLISTTLFKNNIATAGGIIEEDQATIAAANSIITTDHDVEEAQNRMEVRIIGGEEASLEDYPFMAQLGGCGGSLIKPDIILTAAHCQGAISSATVGYAVRQIEGYIPHPNYNRFTQARDIMLLKLNRPITSQTPVELVGSNNFPQTNDMLTVIGYGTTDPDRQSLSSTLQEVDVPLRGNSYCQSRYNGNFDADVMFCAGFTEGGKDSCQGDSGGPILDDDGVQVGVVSWGYGCAEANYPGVYTRISGVSDWIDEQICEHSAYANDDCNNGQGSGSSSQQGSGGSSDQGSGGSSGQGSGGSPQGVSQGSNTIQIRIKYDRYPHENGWVLMDLDQQKELYRSEVGSVKQSGVRNVQLTGLPEGNYYFLFMDEYSDGVCCFYGFGNVKIYEVNNNTGSKKLLWRNNGVFTDYTDTSFQLG